MDCSHVARMNGAYSINTVIYFLLAHTQAEVSGVPAVKHGRPITDKLALRWR